MKKILVVAAISLMTVQAWGENWVQYGSNDFFKASIEADSITTKSDMGIFWTKWDLSRKGKANMFGKNKKLIKRAEMMKIKWLVICDGPDRGVAEMANYTYDKNGGLLESVVLNPPQSHDVIPGSLMESMHTFACSYVNKSNQQKQTDAAQKQ